MALSASSMVAKIKSNIAAVNAGVTQSNDPSNAVGHRDAMLLAFCQGIVDEITQNAETSVEGEKIV